MRIATIIAAIAGLVLGTAIVAYFGFGEVLAALGTIGWSGFAIILLYQLVLYLLLGACWWVIAPLPRFRLGPAGARFRLRGAAAVADRRLRHGRARRHFVRPVDRGLDRDHHRRCNDRSAGAARLHGARPRALGARPS